MYCIVNNNGVLEVYTEENDLCSKCKNMLKCPLLQSIQKEYVFMHYSDVEIKDCALYKR